jgi:hypothetical protein
MADPAGQISSQTDSLAPWAAPYVTEMLGRGEALASAPYDAYTGPLTAGASELQSKYFQGIGALSAPTGMGGFNPQSFTGSSFAQPMGQQQFSMPSTGGYYPSQAGGITQNASERPERNGIDELTMIDQQSHLDGYWGEGGNPNAIENRMTLGGGKAGAYIEGIRANHQRQIAAQDAFDYANPNYEYRAGAGPVRTPTNRAAEQAEQERRQAMFPPLEYDLTTFAGYAPPTAQQPIASEEKIPSWARTFTPEEKRLQSQLQGLAGESSTTADLFKMLGMAPTAQQGQMPSSIFEGLGGTTSGAALDSSLAVQSDTPSYMQGNFGFSGTNTPEEQAQAREMGMTPLQYAQAGGMGDNLDPRAMMAAQQGTQPSATSILEQYMSPYLQGALQPQYDAAMRQAQIQQLAMQSQYGKAGAYGGGRQAVAGAELDRGLLDRMAGITGTGYQNAYEQAQKQFNTEQDRQMDAQQQTNKYGFDVLGAQGDAGGLQRAIESEGIAADYAQFQQERDDPYKKVQYMQSLLQGLPVEALTREYVEPSDLATILGYVGSGAGILKDLFGGANPVFGGNKTTTTTPTS